MFTFLLLVLSAIFRLFSSLQEADIPENLLQASQPDRGNEWNQMDGLAYLNSIRRQAGVNELAYSPVLESAAHNHARYLAEYPIEMYDEHYHDENLTDNPWFTGFDTVQRVKRVGYLMQDVHENITIDSMVEDYPNVPKNYDAFHQIDRLMTAIYHRFSLLSQDIDEAGVSYIKNGGDKIFTVNQGNHHINYLCGLNRKESEATNLYYLGFCNNDAIIYVDEIDEPQQRKYVVYPVGNQAEPDFYNEAPDPMPGYSIMGNPISVEFGESMGDVKMRSFKLYHDEKEISPVHILTHDNDPNKALTPLQFALFPLQPLEYNTTYRAVFEYENRGKKDKIEWTFRTKRPDFPYFIVNGGENLAVQAGKAYFIHWKNQWCVKDCSDFSYKSHDYDADLNVLEYQGGGFLLKVQGDVGDSIELIDEAHKDKTITLYITK